MNIFAKLLIRKNENPQDEKVRENCGKRAGILGIILNTILAGAKIFLGIFSGAVSIMADGFNNLTDCGSNVVSIIGFKMSGKPADKEHPFGHQRAESISAMLISVIILFVALELLTSSIEKIITPEMSAMSLMLIIILSVSIVVKIFMFLLNRGLAKATDSESLMATAIDSISDACSTAVVLIALLVSYFTGFNLDGYAGIAVSLFIAVAGGKLLKETISHLLGKSPDGNTVQEIHDRVFTFEGVCGIHDLAVHNYGPNKMYATVHVEVSAKMHIMSAHELADAIEKDFAENTDIILTVHIDPLVLDDPIINEYKAHTLAILNEVDPTFMMHDFRVVGGDTRSNLVFDVVVPFDCKCTDSDIEKDICKRITDENSNLGVVVTIERQG